MHRHIAVLAGFAMVVAGISLPVAAHADTATVNQLAAQLRVASPVLTGYDRTLFGDWTFTTGDGCDTRANLLKAQTQVPVTFSSGCTVATGQWLSWYDNQTWTNGSQVQIDHLVPLGEAWASGANIWTSAQRSAFANDTTGYELAIVTSSVNESKGDQDPTVWMPPAASAECQYITDWVLSKYRWSLTVDTAEQSAIQGYLAHNNCGAQTVATPAVQIAPPTTTPSPPGAADTLNPGETLPAGSSIASSNGSFTATMQGDGNFVIYRSDGFPMFYTRTNTPGSYMVMQGDGNLVMYRPNGSAAWSSGSPNNAGAHAVLQGDGNFVVYRTSGSAAWFSYLAFPPPFPAVRGSQPTPPAQPTAPTDGSDTVAPSAGLSPGDSIASAGYSAVMQGDGNFVVYGPSGALWSTRTNVAGSYLALQGDGNAVIYAPGGAYPIWATNTSGSSAKLVIQTDGNLVLYGSGRALWNRNQDTSVHFGAPSTSGSGTSGGGGATSPVVTPGAFCSTAGATGVTSKGTPMVCKTSSTDSRLRWRAA